MTRNKSYLNFKYLSLPFLVLALAVGLTLVQRNQAVKKAAAANTCSGKLEIQVSADKTNPSSSVIIPGGIPTKYYVHVTSNGTPCSTNFSVYHCNEPVGQTNCKNQAAWGKAVQWGTYRSNDQGIARIDWDAGFLSNKNRVFHMKLRPANLVDPGDTLWSNEVTQITTGTPLANTVDTSAYWVSTPGYVWEYVNTNNLDGSTGTKTRIQIEEPTNVCPNGKTPLISTPWRITKNSNSAYWDFSPIWGGGVNERWIMASPNFTSNIANFNKYNYMIGDKRYKTFTNTATYKDYQDLNLANPNFGYFFSTKSLHNPVVPGYNYVPKMLPVNFSYLDTFEGESAYMGVDKPNIDYAAAGCNMINTTSSNYSSWKTRIEKDYVTINNEHFKYSGEALRMDNYEGGVPLAISKNLLRESWYFVKNIGLVKIVAKHFNDYNSKTFAYCKDNSDCWDDTIRDENASLVMTLDRYYQNPTLKIELSPDGTNWAANITTTKTNGYYLRTTPAFTGYLEAKNFQGAVHKWLWVENGLVKDQSNLSSFPLNRPFKANFRVWVPNENITAETRVGDTAIPWSNDVTFTLSQ